MSYSINDFEKAINAKGYHLDRIRQNVPGVVHTAYGSVLFGNIVREVYWDQEGKCHSLKRARLPMYDLF